MYGERPSRLPGATLWQLTVPPGGGAHRIVPDGCMDLIWVEGVLLVAGPDTGPHFARGAPGEVASGVRFAPGAAPTLLGVPADELRDRRVPLAGLWPGPVVRRWEEQVAAAPDRTAALELLAVRRSRVTGEPDPVLRAVVDRLRAGLSVAAVATEAGLGERQLHRRSLASFGYGPKMLARVLRLDRALALARAGTSYAAAAATAGYADQAHLARDARALAGVPLGQLIR